MEPRASLVARLVGRNPVAADWLLAGAVTLLAVGQRFGAGRDGGATQATLPALLLVVAGGVPIAWRRRAPLVVLVAVELVVLVHLAQGFALRATGPSLLVALYTVASACGRRVSVRAVVAVALLNTAVVLARPTLAGGEPGDDVLLCAVLYGGSWAVGNSVRTRRAYTAGLEERARRLEAEREERAHRAVTEERARIARELHDVVAHHVSVIAVHAGAAGEQAATGPAREALGLIQTTSRQALAELRALLDVLQADGAAPGLAPQPGMRQLDRLLAQSRAAGLPVELVIRGTPRPLPAILDLAAYRVVQEALTNTRKHAGPAHARVELRYTDDLLELEVTDDGRGSGESGQVRVPRQTWGSGGSGQVRVPRWIRGSGGSGQVRVPRQTWGSGGSGQVRVPRQTWGSGGSGQAGVPRQTPGTRGPAGDHGGGRGLIGMRERVALVGGVLEVGPRPGGGFRVAAALPIDGAP
jgi:signal transduction histidine kinase